FIAFGIGTRSCWRYATRLARPASCSYRTTQGSGGHRHEPAAAHEGLPAHHGRDPPPPAGSSRSATVVHLAGSGSGTAISRAPRVPGLLDAGNRRAPAFRARGVRPSQQPLAGGPCGRRIPPALTDAVRRTP